MCLCYTIFNFQTRSKMCTQTFEKAVKIIQLDLLHKQRTSLTLEMFNLFFQ